MDLIRKSVVCQQTNKAPSNCLLKCDFCTASFQSIFERKIHTITHFERKSCADCNKKIIRIDDNWYELHTSATCNKENISFISNCEYNDDGNSTETIKQEEACPYGVCLIEVTAPVDADIPLSISHIKSEDVKHEDGKNSINALSMPTNYVLESMFDMQPHFKIQRVQSLKEKPKKHKTIIEKRKPTVKRRKSVSSKSNQKISLAELRPLGPCTCDICTKTVKNFRAIHGHMKVHHSPLRFGQKFAEPKPVFTCDICSASLSNYANIKVHMGIHSGVQPYMCNYCGRRFHNPSTMRTHMATHVEERKLICTICGKGFRSHANLKRHMRVHTGEKPYKCPIEGCDRAYAHGIDLKRHKFSAHGIYTKKYICTICSKVYSENKLLRKHMESNQCSEVL